MGAAGAILGGAGGILGGIGGSMAAKSQAKQADLNAKLAKREGYREEARIRSVGRREASENVTRVAKSGVRLEGSPMEVLSENAAKVEAQALRARQAGLLAEALFKQQEQGFQTASTMALVGGALQAGSSVAGGLGGGGGSAGGGGGPGPLNPGQKSEIAGAMTFNANADMSRRFAVPRFGTRY